MDDTSLFSERFKSLDTEYKYNDQHAAEVKKLLASGHTSPQIAQAMGLDIRRVNYYRYSYKNEEAREYQRKYALKRRNKRRNQKFFPDVIDTDEIEAAPEPKAPRHSEKIIMVPVPKSKLAEVAEVLWQS